MDDQQKILESREFDYYIEASQKNRLLLGHDDETNIVDMILAEENNTEEESVDAKGLNRFLQYLKEEFEPGADIGNCLDAAVPKDCSSERDFDFDDNPETYEKSSSANLKRECEAAITATGEVKFELKEIQSKAKECVQRKPPGVKAPANRKSSRRASKKSRHQKDEIFNGNS